ncbi:alpha/beta fold hydrolase [Actinomadura fibrosa]|uniref:Alpha/beta fold hydrolase n=1 Tax=Actinomadura fibrosa TaxID=111802 RepID=A0ABW2XJY8_9ACTN|nr:alpha/beta hydrolase [Actinomadura fibrosa]
MTGITHRFVEPATGLRTHVAEAGEGPLVVLLHGFPECWYSWRHQLTALADAGFHAVAPDQRGYARTGGPSEVDKYTILHLVGDVIALIDALGEEQAVVVGHDWGAPVAWATAQLRPDRLRGVAALSVPHRRRTAGPPVELMRRAYGDRYYMVQFQRPGAPEAEFDRDRADTFRRALAGSSGDGPVRTPVYPEDGGFLDISPAPDKLPGWLTEDDIAVFVEEYAESGFTGPLNWYRNLDRNWELTAAWHDAPIRTPALYIAGDRDPVVTTPGARKAIDLMHTIVPGLRDTVWLPGCGHWTQQERPAEVNDALIGFLRGL